ncbi:hypothetical protein TRVL_08943 [Trypanosoma vivax]|nr:hypothetical protein TRVL_08943 [Trypanosoma vivax]
MRLAAPRAHRTQKVSLRHFTLTCLCIRHTCVEFASCQLWRYRVGMGVRVLVASVDAVCGRVFVVAFSGCCFLGVGEPGAVVACLRLSLLWRSRGAACLCQWLHVWAYAPGSVEVFHCRDACWKSPSVR